MLGWSYIIIAGSLDTYSDDIPTWQQLIIQHNQKCERASQHKFYQFYVHAEHLSETFAERFSLVFIFLSSPSRHHSVNSTTFASPSFIHPPQSLACLKVLIVSSSGIDKVKHNAKKKKMEVETPIPPLQIQTFNALSITQIWRILCAYHSHMLHLVTSITGDLYSKR